MGLAAVVNGKGGGKCRVLRVRNIVISHHDDVVSWGALECYPYRVFHSSSLHMLRDSSYSKTLQLVLKKFLISQVRLIIRSSCTV